jgi:hypothetical protein
MIDWLCTRERAIEHGMEQARDLARCEGHSVVLVLERDDGEVERELVVDDAAPVDAVWH